MDIQWVCKLCDATGEHLDAPGESPATAMRAALRDVTDHTGVEHVTHDGAVEFAVATGAPWGTQSVISMTPERGVLSDAQAARLAEIDAALASQGVRSLR